MAPTIASTVKAVAMGHFLPLRPVEEDSSSVSPNISSHLHCSDLTPESESEVPLRRKIKRPPMQAACVFPGNNYGFFGVGAGRAGVVAGRVAVPADPAGLGAGAEMPAGFSLS